MSPSGGRRQANGGNATTGQEMTDEFGFLQGPTSIGMMNDGGNDLLDLNSTQKKGNGQKLGISMVMDPFAALYPASMSK